ncbi:hypothetical protein TREMEDRAFT_36003 [Tremella mesenterica DSM 1558]|uniref:uncharacterized protein n=1 Tax=Tremella mesenterica (strain ATCC 24925 / CBS 8224 / DSM 1558 / NBRC 9311 / NRRL Y-6157 / RJB 2259-6 / UBC 559-6) TaxID=578456 RepID=UPI00032B9EC5|nr:uncharacterized protein TREMEDRAFT_36003 [Tremella mesenterica DSM 1558]EIW65744.1 hypothetical protein TREMEDRAFT_36003 [Tremella mesenterica DSM 1558]
MLPLFHLLIPILLSLSVNAGIFDSSTTTTAAASSSSSSTTSSSNSEVAFLQTIQAAQITSMSCLITLVNMTTQPIGSCLGLTTLAGLIADPSPNAAFSDQLSSYLNTMCAAGGCSDADIADAQGQLDSGCGDQGGTSLISVLKAVLGNYQSSYKTLACSVHFNGTAALCLPATLNTSTTADTNTFFNDLLSGNNLGQYDDSIFGQAQCTGCMYELYKAA